MLEVPKIDLQNYKIAIDFRDDINKQCKEKTDRLRKMLGENKLPTGEEWGSIVYDFFIGLASDTEISKRTEVVELLRAALMKQKETAYKQETDRLVKVSEKELTPDFIAQWRELQFPQLEMYPEFGKNDTGISQSEIARRRAVEEVINKAIPSPYCQGLSLNPSQLLVTDEIFDIVLQGDQNKDAE